MDVVADVYETDLPRLRMGAPAEVVVPGEDRRFTATVRDIGWTVRRQTQANTDPVAAVDSRTVEVRLALDEAGTEALRAAVQHAGAGGDPAMNALTKSPLLPWAPENTGEPGARAGHSLAPRGAASWIAGCAVAADAARLASVRAERARLFSAIAGVMFAAVLVFMQLGFRSAPVRQRDAVAVERCRPNCS